LRYEVRNNVYQHVTVQTKLVTNNLHPNKRERNNTTVQYRTV